MATTKETQSEAANNEAEGEEGKEASEAHGQSPAEMWLWRLDGSLRGGVNRKGGNTVSSEA